MQTTMFKIRARDKFVVVKEAPWRVFDHIEIFLNPSEIKLTHHFYTQFKIFFFENNPLTNLEKSKAGTYSLFKTVKVLKKSVMGMQMKKETLSPTNDIENRDHLPFEVS